MEALLYKFGVQNFKSILSPVSIDMEKVFESNSLKHGHYIRLSKEDINLSILKYAGIFGYQCTGKTNIINAMKFMHEIVIENSNIGISNINFSSHAYRGTHNNPSDIGDFMIQFYYDEYVYLYEFHINYNTHKFDYERLISIPYYELTLEEFPIEKSKIIFCRNHEDEEWSITSDLEFKGEDIIIWDYYRNKFSKDDQSSFLMLSDLHLESVYTLPENSVFQILRKMYRWISSINFITPTFNNIYCYHLYDRENILALHKMLEFFNIDVKSIKVIDIRGMIKAKNPDRSDEFISNKVREFMERFPNEIQMRSMQSFDSNEFYILKVFGEHEDENDIETWTGMNLSINNLIHYCMILFQMLEEDSIFIIDDFGNNLDPDLAKALMGVIQTINASKQNQFIFTTNQTILMSVNVFRLDEIWFVDKRSYDLNEPDDSEDIRTVVYPLSAFDEYESFRNPESKYRFGMLRARPEYHHIDIGEDLYYSGQYFVEDQMLMDVYEFGGKFKEAYDKSYPVFFNV